MSKRIYKGSLLATTIIAGLSIAMPAYAQDTDTTDEGTTAETGPGVQPAEAVPAAEDDAGEIVITGTLIRNPNLTSSSPVAVVGQEEISLTQATSAEEIIRDIPGVVPNLGSNVNNGTVGSSRVDLRGLGSQRNLVMLDSTRLTPSNFVGAVDLNNIPVALVDRIDVLTGGASTTYGADAVSGVVNFITKKDFAGLDLQVTEAITERGDTNNFRADLVLGANFDDGRGNAVLALSYMEADELFFADREIGRCTISSLSGICGGDSPTATPTSFALGAARNALLGFGPAVGNVQIGPTNNTLVSQYSLFNFNPYNIYSLPFKRHNVYASANYDVSDSISVYGRGLFSKNVTSSIIAPSGVFGEALTVPGWNQFLTTQLRDQLCVSSGLVAGSAACINAPALSLGNAYRRTTEVGPRISEYTTNYFDMKAGVSWDITQNINFDLYGAYGESDNRQVLQNYVAKSRLQQALNTTNTAAGSQTCTNTANGCVPLNLFGQPGTITPQMAGFIGGISSSVVQKATLAQVHGVVSGDFGFAMPWSTEAVAFAVGAEHRDYGAIRDPDNLSQVPGELGGAGGAVLPIRGGYTAEDFFGELIVPIASDRPFMQELTLEAGIRYSKYKVDTIGDPKFNATTYKIGGTWQPIEALKFRANYQKAVRAPNIGELFAPVVTFLTNLATDPCAGQITNPAGAGYNAALATNLNLRAVCIAQGAPVGAIGAIQNPAAAQSNATGGGNPLLTPETSKSYTFGVVINPRSWLPGFSATIDYYNIRVTEAITRPLPGDTIAQCFGSATGAGVTAAAAASPACLAIRRSTVNGRLSGSPATVAGLPAPLTNAGELYTDGVDLTMNYRRNVGFADLTLNFAGNWTRTAKFWADPGSPNQLPPPNCPGLYSANCGISVGQLQPDYSWNQRSTLSFEHVDISLLWRHISKFKYQPDLLPLCEPGLPAAVNPSDAAGIACTGVIVGGPFAGHTARFNRIPAYNYFDLTTRFNVTDHFELTLSAFNIFDKKVPIVGTNAGTTTANSGNTFPSTYDVLGRRYSATARIKF